MQCISTGFNHLYRDFVIFCTSSPGVLKIVEKNWTVSWSIVFPPAPSRRHNAWDRNEKMRVWHVKPLSPSQHALRLVHGEAFQCLPPWWQINTLTLPAEHTLTTCPPYQMWCTICWNWGCVSCAADSLSHQGCWRSIYGRITQNISGICTRLFSRAIVLENYWFKFEPKGQINFKKNVYGSVLFDIFSRFVL